MPKKSIKILIADDTNISRIGIKAILESHPDIAIIGEAYDAPSIIPLAIDLKPDIVGMSCLLQIGYDKLKKTVSKIKENVSISETRPVFIIGGIVDKTICEYVEADFYTNDAMDGVRICQKVVKELREL